MCTRYYIEKDAPELNGIMRAVQSSSLSMRFISKFGRPVIMEGEVRPTDIVPVIAPSPKGIRSVYPMQWGFQNPNHGSTLFNARTETAGIKPTFKDSWKNHRCIIPASYYYEWEHHTCPDGRTKTGDKYAIQPCGAAVTWLCGLYRIENGFPVFVILTREPDGTLRSIHDRMPFMLPAEHIDEWISPVSEPANLLQYALTDMILDKEEPASAKDNNQLTIHSFLSP